MTRGCIRLPEAKPGNNPGAVHIVLAADKKFLPFCAATMASVLDNSPRQDDLHFHILTDAPFPELDVTRFDKLRRIRDFEWEQHIVSGDNFQDLRTTPGISVATYFRLMLPSVLPESIEKVVYIDCDLVVLDRIRKLYDIDLEDRLLLGVEDSISIHYNEQFGDSRDAIQVNGGVLVMNLRGLRDANYREEIRRYIEANKFTIILGDQQILNCVFGKRAAYVHPRWNVHGSMFVEDWRKQSVGERNLYRLAEIEAAVRTPAIIHYTYKRKPWQSNEHPRYTDYLRYLRMTDYWADFAESVPNIGPDQRIPLVIKRSRKLYRKGRAAVRKWWGRQVDSMVEKRVARETRVARIVTKYAAAAAYDQWMNAIAAMRTSELRIDQLAANPQPFRHWIGNASVRDLDGGELQNYKILMQSNRLSNPNADPTWKQCDALFLCRWRDGESQQLAVLQHAASFAKPIFFVETSFFGGCVTWANRDAPIEFRRPFGFIVDDLAYYYDATRSSRIRTKLASEEYEVSADDKAEAARLIKRVLDEQLTKYNSMPADLPAVLRRRRGERVLVIDQTRGDASIDLGRASDETFASMLQCAIDENPKAEIYIKTHPDSMVRERSARPGHYGPEHASDRVKLLSDTVNPRVLLESFDKVYVVSSQMGFEALLGRKKVVCFGEPFYAGLDLTDDRSQFLGVKRRSRSLEELFHVVCVEHSHYVDPRTGQPCSIDRAFDFASEMRRRFLTLRSRAPR